MTISRNPAYGAVGGQGTERMQSATQGTGPVRNDELVQKLESRLNSAVDQIRERIAAGPRPAENLPKAPGTGTTLDILV